MRLGPAARQSIERYVDLSLTGVVYGLFVDMEDSDHDMHLETKRCQIDACLIKDLGANTIRLMVMDYVSSSSSPDYDGCMRAFVDAGIYAWVAVIAMVRDRTVGYLVAQSAASQLVLRSPF